MIDQSEIRGWVEDYDRVSVDAEEKARALSIGARILEHVQLKLRVESSDPLTYNDLLQIVGADFRTVLAGITSAAAEVRAKADSEGRIASGAAATRDKAIERLDYEAAA